MVKRNWSRIGFVAVLFMLVAAAALAQRSRYDPATSQPSGQQSKPRQGFLDFTLKQINPSDQDYGECIAEARQLAVEQTVQNSLFWSNLTAIGMLVFSVAMVVFQSKEWKRRELMVATCLAQYHNLLVRSRRAAYEAISRYNTLVEARNVQVERQLPEPVSRKESFGKDGPTRAPIEDQPAIKAQPAAAGGNAQAPPKVTSNAPRPSYSAEQEADLVAKVNILQHQLTAAQDQVRAAQEREQNLRQKLSQYERRPSEEKDQTRDPKGA